MLLNVEDILLNEIKFSSKRKKVIIPSIFTRYDIYEKIRHSQRPRKEKKIILTTNINVILNYHRV